MYSVNAQSAEELVTIAKEYSPALKAMKLEYKAALLKVNQVKDWPDPTVNIGIGVLPIETRLGAQRLKLGLTQMIPWKGTIDAKSEVAKSIAEIKSNLDKVKEIDIEYAIRTAYNSLQFLEAKKKILRQRLEVLDALEELSKSAVRAGKGKLSNVLFIERKRELIEADIKLISKKMEQPTIMINRWTGRALKTSIKISPALETEISKDNALQYAQTDHPQYRILENKITASKSKINLTSYQSKPRIGVGLDYSFISKRNDVEISRNGRDVLMPMGSISIPLHTNRYGAIRQEEAIKQESINAQRNELQDIYNTEIEMAYSTIQYADQIKIKYETLKKITKETLKLMRTEYASEGTRFEELLRLEMELIDYDMEILSADYERWIAVSLLHKYKS